MAGCGDSATVSLYIHVPVTNFGSFTATAVDSVTGNQITDTQITSECGDPPSVQNGVFTFSNVDVGQDVMTSTSCSADFNAPNYYPGSALVTVNAGQTTSITFDLVPMESATVNVTVTDALSGAPLNGISVTPSAGQGMKTNAAGQFTVSGNDLLGSNNAPRNLGFTFVDQSANYLSTTADVEAIAGQTSALTVAMTRECGPAVVTGTVYNASNQAPIAGASVGPSGDSKQTDSNGDFLLLLPLNDNLPSNVTITASASGFNSKSETIALYCGAHIVLDFGQNSSETGTLTGTVTNAVTHAVVANAFVGASFGTTTTTNSQGQYTFANVPVGNNNLAESWTITVDPPAGSPLQPQIQSIAIPGNVTTTLNFGLGSVPPSLPVAIDHAETTPENVILNVPAASGLLVGDSGTDIMVTGNQNPGTLLTVNPDGSFTYVPDGNFEGIRTFTYTITDAYGAQSTALVTVTIGTVPTAADYIQSMMAGTTLNVFTAAGLASQDTPGGLQFCTVNACRAWHRNRLPRGRLHLHPRPRLLRPGFIHLHRDRPRFRHRSHWTGGNGHGHHHRECSHPSDSAELRRDHALQDAAGRRGI